MPCACRPCLPKRVHPHDCPQVPDSEIDPVQQLPRLEEMHAGENADLKVRASCCA